MTTKCFFTGVTLTNEERTPYTKTKEHLVAKNHPWYDPKNGPRNCVSCSKYVNSTLGHMPLFAKLEFKRRFAETTNIYPSYKEKVKAIANEVCRDYEIDRQAKLSRLALVLEYVYLSKNAVYKWVVDGIELQLASEF
jgi:hypothetical protein